MYFHGARFSNYEAWLSDPTHIKPSAQVVWPVVGQEILNGDVGGGFQGIQITSGFFQLWRASGITSELQLYTTAIGGLILAGAMFFAGWFHYHKAAPKLEWFQNVESMLNHHLGGLLGLGSLAWAGHQIHISLPVNKLLDAGVDPKEIPLPHELLLNRSIIADLYPSFSKGLAPFFTLNWSEYSDFLTFKGGLNPVTGGLWLSDTAHHHLAIAVLFLVAGHMYRTNWGIGHSMKEILEAHKGPFTGEGHVGLYEILTTSWHAQLAINLALFGSLSIIVAHRIWVTLNFTICWDSPPIFLAFLKYLISFLSVGNFFILICCFVLAYLLFRILIFVFLAYFSFLIFPKYFSAIKEIMKSTKDKNKISKKIEKFLSKELRKNFKKKQIQWLLRSPLQFKLNIYESIYPQVLTWKLFFLNYGTILQVGPISRKPIVKQKWNCNFVLDFGLKIKKRLSSKSLMWFFDHITKGSSETTREALLNFNKFYFFYLKNLLYTLLSYFIFLRSKKGILVNLLFFLNLVFFPSPRLAPLFLTPVPLLPLEGKKREEVKRWMGYGKKIVDKAKFHALSLSFFSKKLL